MNKAKPMGNSAKTAEFPGKFTDPLKEDFMHEPFGNFRFAAKNILCGAVRYVLSDSACSAKKLRTNTVTLRVPGVQTGPAGEISVDVVRRNTVP